MQHDVVILSPLDPSEDVKSLLLEPWLINHVTFSVGSALSTDDLVRVSADKATAIFFFSNLQVPREVAEVDGAATVLRALSLRHCNPQVRCLVQVLRNEERQILNHRCGYIWTL